MTRQAEAAPIALTMGDPAGIGGEIALAAWARRRDGVPPFVLLDDPERVRALASRLGQSADVVELSAIDGAGAAFADAVPVWPVARDVRVTPGRPDPAAGKAVIASIDTAVEMTMRGETSAVVTNPIHKATLYQSGFRHPGHTEYLADKAGATDRPVMLLACGKLRVVPVTVHLSLRDAIEALDVDGIVHCARLLAESLRRDFGIASPRIAVAGLNPHAGEEGHLGREEIEIIGPAVRQIEAAGIRVSGPRPPDTLFHDEAREGYDGAVCMYHDQALIPLKTLDFHGGVNVTLGLPFVRTSPDHGTAFDIAGKGDANPESLIAALRLAASMAGHRQGGKKRRAVA